MAGTPYEINIAGTPKADATSRGWGKQFPEPDHGLDCSGGVLNVFQKEGLLLHLDPLYTSCDTLDGECDTISKASALPGDLVFFVNTYNTSGLSHVGIVTEGAGSAMFSFVGPRATDERLPGRFRSNLSHYGRVRALL